MHIELWHKNGEWLHHDYKTNFVPAIGDFISIPGDPIFEVVGRTWLPTNQKKVVLIIQEVNR
jgi:hypothetical protein